MLQRIARRLGYEKRETTSYTDAVVAAILGGARNQSAQATATAALETCAGVTGRGFASARVTGLRASALDPQTLAILGRALIRRGESLFWVRPGGDGVRLVPVSTYAITGDYDPASWSYELSLAGPSWTGSVKVPAADVVHVRTNVEPDRPWRGVAPVEGGRHAAELAAQLAKAMADEAAGPRGSFLPGPGADLTGLAADAKGANGSMLLVESMAGSFQSGLPSPKGDWEQRRFGFNAPQQMVLAMDSAHEALMGAVGISAALFRARDAASAQIAYRTFAHSLLGPLGRLAMLELRAKLDSAELTIDFEDLRAGDLAARARGFKALVEGGMEIPEALGVSGLMARD